MRTSNIRFIHVGLKLLALIALAACSFTGCSSGTAGSESELVKLEKGLRQAAKLTDRRELKVQTRSRGHTEEGKTTSPRPLTPRAPKQPVRAIYVSSHVANGSRLKELVRLLDETELNAMVLDVNSGIALTSPGRQKGKESEIVPIPSDKRPARHFREVVKELKKQRVYLIARIVTFKNPELAKAVPSWALKRKNGKIWTDRNGTPWIDPYQQKSWGYPIALAEYAAKLGFDEVQFDYVRFPENASKVDEEVSYANPQGRTKDEAIQAFLHRARARLRPAGVLVSADVFGMVGSSEDDMGIGQKWNKIVREVDVVSPMIYPSHYSGGIWGIRHPDLTPGPIIRHALEDATKKNRKLNGQGIATAKVRPWLQGFTAGWVDPHQKYGQAQIREQVLAAKRSGITSYMLWNSSCRYPEFTI